MKITSKGQVTIPQEIREALGLLPETEVEWQIRGDVAVIRKRRGRNRRGRALVERMTGRGNVRMTTDEILALTRGES